MVNETIGIIAFWIGVATSFRVMESPGRDKEQRVFRDEHVLIPVVLSSTVWEDYRDTAEDQSGSMNRKLYAYTGWILIPSLIIQLT